MKYYLLFFMVAFSAIDISAQGLVKDFFRSQSKLKKEGAIPQENPSDSVLYIEVDSTGSVITQVQPGIDTMDIEALKQHFFIIRQDYSLYDKKKKKYYGFNDHEQFGFTFSLGLKCNGFNLLFDEAVHPWTYDDNYPAFSSNKLEPRITKSRYLLLDDSIIYNYIDLDTIVYPTQTVKSNVLYAGKPFVSLQKGLAVNTTDTCQAGILVWITKKSGSLEDGTIKVDLELTPTKIGMVGSITIIPPSKREVLGCVLVTSCENDDTEYNLAGVASKKDGQWILSFPFKNFKYENGRTPAAKTKGRLTEIKKPSKK